MGKVLGEKGTRAILKTMKDNCEKKSIKLFKGMVKPNSTMTTEYLKDIYASGCNAVGTNNNFYIYTIRITGFIHYGLSTECYSPFAKEIVLGRNIRITCDAETIKNKYIEEDVLTCELGEEAGGIYLLVKAGRLGYIACVEQLDRNYA